MREGKSTAGPALQTFSGNRSTVERPLSPTKDVEAGASKETLEAIQRIKQNAIQGMVADMKAAGIEIDDANIKAAIDNYENQPGVKQEAMKAVKSMLQSLQGKTPDEIAETLAQDSLAVFEAGKSKSEIPLDNVLIPLLMSQGQIQQAELDKASKKNLRNVRLSTNKLKTGALSATKTAISRTAIPSAYLVHFTLGVVDTAVVETAANGTLSDWGLEGKVKDGLALAFSAAANAQFVNRKLGVRGEWVRGIGDMVWGDTTRTRVTGVLTSALMATMALAITANTERGIVDSAVSEEVGNKMKERWETERKAMESTIRQAASLFQTIQPVIDKKMSDAYVAGGVGWGPRTWGVNRVLYGKNAESDSNYAAFKSTPATTTPTFRGKAMSTAESPTAAPEAPGRREAATAELAAAQKRLDAINKQAEGKSKAEKTKKKADLDAARLRVTNAQAAINAPSRGTPAPGTPDTRAAKSPEEVEAAMKALNEKYGLQPTDGAEQYLKKLTADIERVNPENVFAMLDSLIKESEVLSKSGILGNIFGILAPVPGVMKQIGTNVWQGEGLGSFTHDIDWSETFHRTSGVRAIFKSEEKYRNRRNEMVKELKKVMVSTQLDGYLKEASAVTGMDTTMSLPNTSFSVENDALGIDQTPYKDIANKTVFDYVTQIVPPDDSPTWGYIQRSFSKSGIDSVDVSTPLGKKAAMTLLISFVILLIGGSVLYTIGAKKVSKRWGVMGALKDDEKNGIYKTESKLVQDMVKLIDDREKTTLGAIAKSGLDVALPQRDSVALSAVLQKRLREHVLSLMNPPLDKTPEGIAFINRENSLGSRKLRHEYVGKLNEYIDGYKNDRSGSLAAILRDIDSGRYAEISAIKGFVESSRVPVNREIAAKNVADWWSRIDSKFTKTEVESRKAEVQNLYAQREALSSLRPAVKIELNGSIPSDVISPADIVYMNRLADIDADIAIHHETIKRITDGKVDGPVERNQNVVFSTEQTQSLQSELQEEELGNTIEGADITKIAKEYSTLVQSLGKRIGSMEGLVSRAFGDQASGSKISFEYAYRDDLRGPAIVLNLVRPDGDVMTLPLRQVVPSVLLSSDEAIMGAIAQWLRPDSQEMQVTRLYAVHDSYATAVEEIKKEVLSGSTGGTLDIASIDDAKLANIQDLIRRSDVLKVQRQLIKVAESPNASLNQVQQKVFEQPDKVTLSGIWNKDIRITFRFAKERYPGIPIMYDVATEELVIPDPTGEKRISIRSPQLG